jgi:DNA repair protein RadC
MFVDFYIGRQEEQISCIFLDKEGTYIKTSLLFRGSMQSVGFSVRPIVDEALKCGAYKVALAHNHPSGSLTPSPSDIDSTRYLNRSLSQMNIFLIEHFVISGDKYKGIKEFVEKDMYPNLK